MVNPIYQQDEELLLNPFGSKYLGATEHTGVNSNEFVVQEDAVISVLTGGDASIAENDIDYKASMNLSGVTLKKGALIVAPVGEAFKSITIDSGSIMAYNSVVEGTKPITSILEFSPFNVWDSEHVVIDGTTTTFTDFNNVGATYDLVNPAATNQPTYTASDTNFNNLPSLTFNGVDDYVTNFVSNFRGSDSSGVLINVVRVVSNNLIAALGSYNNTETYNYVGYSVANVGDVVRIISAAPNNVGNNLRIYLGSTDVLTGRPPFAFANVSTGSEYKIFVNNNQDTVTETTSASNDGAIWFNDGTQNNIAIGARNVSSLSGAANIEWCFSGYFPYESDSQVEEIMAYLVTKYNL